jgi:hypothetical protein
MTERRVAETQPVPVIEGASLLLTLGGQNLDRDLGILFHGSVELIEGLQPRPVYWKFGERYYADSESPVVCATDDPLIAVFMALAPRNGLPFGYNENQDGGITFHLT